MKKLLKAKDMKKTYHVGKESQTVLNEVSLEMDYGEFTVIMGASGSGKSTLLYALSGMDGIDEGERIFDGEDLSNLSDQKLSTIRREKMGFVFQQPTLLKNLNIVDNILLPQMRDHRKEIKSLSQKAIALMEQAGIGGLGERDITQVSGGQLQRAGICRALMNQPKILFADEPTGALNSKSAEEIMDLFSMIHHNGTAVLLVTHDVKVAARAERVLFMKDGKIISQLVLKDFQTEGRAKKIERLLAETNRLAI